MSWRDPRECTALRGTDRLANRGDTVTLPPMHWVFSATVRDLSRAPGVRLLLVGVLVIALALPRIPMPGASFTDQQRLGTEIVWATLMLVVGVAAAAAGAVAAQRDSPRGFAPELASTPLAASSYVAGRVAAVAGLAGVAGAIVAAGVQLWGTVADVSSMPPPTAVALPLVAALQGAMCAAFGLALGTLVPTETAVLASILVMWAARFAFDGHPTSVALIPDPGSPLSGRQIALNGLPSGGDIVALAAAAALQTAGWTLVAAARIRSARR